MNTSIWWIRRDMRVTDNKALQLAAKDGDVVPLFVVDPRFEKAGSARRAFMFDTIRSLDAATGGKLVLRYGDPVVEVAQMAKEVGKEKREFVPVNPNEALMTAAMADFTADARKVLSIDGKQDRTVATSVFKKKII